MKLNGSCHCGAVGFTLESHTPYPYMCCYCTVCRKTAGGGGYAINIMGEKKSLRVRGREHLRVYRARIEEGGKSKVSSARRHFCGVCGSALWIWDPRWAQWVYPFASAIDTPLPKPRERVHLMLNHAAPWVQVGRGRNDTRFPEYPAESIAEWHQRRGLEVK
jgi:hypothetical protein